MDSARLIKELEAGREAKRIPLTKGMFATVSAEDYDKVSGFKWTALKTPEGRFYAVRRVNGGMIYLHRFLLEAVTGQYVDHVDGDGTNNVRGNLRLCTNAENNRNKGLTKRNKSGFKGVFWYQPLKKWQTYIQSEGDRFHLGYFADKIDAAKRYDVAAKLLHGKFARLNFS